MKPSLRGLNDYLITKAVVNNSVGIGGHSQKGETVNVSCKPLNAVSASTAI